MFDGAWTWWITFLECNQFAVFSKITWVSKPHLKENYNLIIYMPTWIMLEWYLNSCLLVAGKCCASPMHVNVWSHYLDANFGNWKGHLLCSQAAGESNIQTEEGIWILAIERMKRITIIRFISTSIHLTGKYVRKVILQCTSMQYIGPTHTHT